MRIAFFHDDDPRIHRLRGELSGRGHRVLVIGPGASSRFLRQLFDEERPDILHSLGRGPTALFTASLWSWRLRGQGARRVADVEGLPLVSAVVDGSLPGEHLEAAYLRVLRGA